MEIGNTAFYRRFAANGSPHCIQGSKFHAAGTFRLVTRA